MIIPPSCTTLQQCMKFLPHIGGAIFLFMIVFSLYVRSVPPVTVPKVTVPQPEFQGGTPEFTAVNTESKVNIAIEDTPAVDKEPNESEETIDL